MKHTFFILVSLFLLTSCSTVDKWNLKSELPNRDIPLLEPFTDITWFTTDYRQQTHNDSLTSVAHRLLLETLVEKRDELRCGELLYMSDTTRYRQIGEQMDSLSRMRKLPADAVPPLLLEIMEEKGIRYLTLILYQGYEHNPAYTHARFPLIAEDDEYWCSNGACIHPSIFIVDAQKKAFSYYSHHLYNGCISRNNLSFFKRKSREIDGLRPTDKNSIYDCLQPLFNSIYLLDE